jgi:hypothetical protein
MAKLNEGDVIEGIFSIAIAQLFAFGRIDKSKLNSLRTKIDPGMFSTGKFTTTVREYVDGNPKDKIKVTLTVRLKPASVSGAFGPNYEPLYKSSRDVGNIDQKINQLITQTNTNYSKRIETIKNNFLKNNQSDTVDIEIVADGIAGESSGGTIKGDIEVKVTINGKESMDDKLSFSLKSGSKTLANLSPFNGMMDIVSRFGVSLKERKKYQEVLGKTLASAKTSAEKRMKVELIEELYSEIKKELRLKSGTSKFSNAAYQLFKDSAFGSDLAEVVDINKTKIKEMNVKTINDLQQSGEKITCSISGNNLKFLVKNKELFQMRFKKRAEEVAKNEYTIKELKFYIEAGPAAYSK